MKTPRYQLLFLAFLFGNTLSAQVFDTQTTWYYCQPMFPPNPEKCYIFKLENASWNRDTLNNDFGNIKVKQFDKKVWMDGKLHYDFNLGAGDSIRIHLDVGEETIFFIDSVKTSSLHGKNRLMQFIHSGDINMVLVEGLGTGRFIKEEFINSTDFFLDQGFAYINSIADPSLGLTYFEDGDIIYGPLGFGECYSCDQSVSLKENTSSDISLLLHSQEEIISIKGLLGQSIIQIYNASGQLHYTTKSQSQTEEISIAELRAGVYFVRISKANSRETTTLKFVKY